MAYRRAKNERLVYYGANATPDFWAEHWHSYGHLNMSSEMSGRGLSVAVQRYLPRKGKVIEAGCGVGQVVFSLRARGYDIEGVEWSQETVDWMLRGTPDAPVRAGDVTKLDVPDGYYQGYLSLGVVEHREEGPDPFLAEAVRVLADDGVALISVPCFNPLRRLKAALGAYRSKRDDPEDVPFYQYAFAPSEFKKLLANQGLEVVAMMPLGAVKGAKDDLPGVGPLVAFARKRLRRGRRGTPGDRASQPSLPAPRMSRLGAAVEWAFERYAFTVIGHTMLYVCRKAR